MRTGIVQSVPVDHFAALLLVLRRLVGKLAESSSAVLTGSMSKSGFREMGCYAFRGCGTRQPNDPEAFGPFLCLLSRRT